MSPRPLTAEGRVERDLEYLFRTCGGEVVRFSQGARGRWDNDEGKFIADPRGTRQTPGIPDYEVWFCKAGIMLKFEAKSPLELQKFNRERARLATPHLVPKSAQRDHERVKHQWAYELRCRACGVAYGRGGVAEAVALLTSLGLYRGHP